MKEGFVERISKHSQIGFANLTERNSGCLKSTKIMIRSPKVTIKRSSC